MGVGARRVGLSISAPDTTIWFAENVSKKEKNPVDSNCMNNRGLVDAEKKETDCLAKVAQIPTCYNQGMQNVIFKHTPALKKMGNGSRISNRVTISSAKN